MPSPPRLAAGSVFASDYRVDRALFEGEDRAVYAVEQISTGRPLALKVLLPEAVPDEPSKQRFLDEARVGGRVQSVHVVDVRGVGVDESTSFPWVLTELLEGSNLGQTLAKMSEPPLGSWDELLSQALHGLAAVHAVGVVHGGLNDESIFLAVPTTPDEPFRVELLDFGIPRSARMKAPSQAARLPWLAPEQLDGSDPKATSDVWALGLVAFHILTGRPYFKAAKGKSPDLAALRTEIAAGTTEAASARAKSLGYSGALPKNFDTWFARCTSLDATKRFPDAREALDGAADLLAEASAVDASEVEEEPEQAAPRKAKPPPLPPMVAALAQNPKPAILAIVVLMLAALGGGFGLGALRGPKKSAADESRAKATVWAQGSLEASNKACDGGDPTACNGLGQMYLYGQKTPRDEVKAAQHFQRGCEKSDQPSCANLAAALLAGESVPKDPARAVDLYRKACDGGDNISCADLSDIYRNGNGVPKDEAQATLLRDKACKAGMTEICKPLAREPRRPPRGLAAGPPPRVPPPSLSPDALPINGEIVDDLALLAAGTGGPAGVADRVLVLLVARGRAAGVVVVLADAAHPSLAILGAVAPDEAKGLIDLLAALLRRAGIRPVHEAAPEARRALRARVAVRGQARNLSIFGCPACPRPRALAAHPGPRPLARGSLAARARRAAAARPRILPGRAG